MFEVKKVLLGTMALRTDGGVSAPGTPNERWFTHEVLPNEPSLRAYLRAKFPRVSDVDDVVQTSYLRIWRKRAEYPITSVRAFLFTTAKRLAIDILRRERRSPVSIVGDLSGLDVLDDGPGVAARVGRAECVQLLVAAIDSLPPRCREVVILRKLKFHSQREVAHMLGISEDGVEIQLTRGIARCREYLRRRGINSLFDREG